MTSHDFLVELGTEELPPKALKTMRDGFSNAIIAGLKQHQLSFDQYQRFASARRLALLVRGLASKAADKTISVEGPPKKVALDSDGNFSKAAQGFAAKNGISLDNLQFEATAKGEKLVHRATQVGATAEAVLADIVTAAIAATPVPKRMRWGDSRHEFSRPVQWLVMLLDNKVVPTEAFNLTAANLTRGHRFHADNAIEIDTPAQYEALLRDRAYVIADYEKRRDNIRQQVLAQAATLGGKAVMDDALLDEVCGLVEYPVALSGSFEERFLKVPKEALISSMISHQKYFPVIDVNGALMPHFIFISNIDSDDPSQVINGNERVIRPRLADAVFFYETDLKTSLADRLPALDRVVFQTKLGSIGAKSRRIAALARTIAASIGADQNLASRAGELCKADLVSEMVLEFSDLQGVAGAYYANNDGEDAAVATAIQEHYAAIPSTDIGAVVAMADRIDSLAGIFGIGLHPTGSKDPFALRRAALGIIRIIQTKGYSKLSLTNLIDTAIKAYGDRLSNSNTTADLAVFFSERYRSIYNDLGISCDCLLAVQAATDKSQNPYDVDLRVKAVAEFKSLKAAEALSATNKRVANILAKNQVNSADIEFSNAKLQEPAETSLADAVAAISKQVEVLVEDGNYSDGLALLVMLSDPLDAFFDKVMVMSDDFELRNNRIALLQRVRSLFILTADISELQF